MSVYLCVCVCVRISLSRLLSTSHGSRHKLQHEIIYGINADTMSKRSVQYYDQITISSTVCNTFTSLVSYLNDNVCWKNGLTFHLAYYMNFIFQKHFFNIVLVAVAAYFESLNCVIYSSSLQKKNIKRITHNFLFIFLSFTLITEQGKQTYSLTYIDINILEWIFSQMNTVF